MGETKILEEKLRQTEKQLSDLTTESAEMYAKTSRTIAYIEAENSRQKELIEHYKDTNTQLTDELKQVTEEILRAKSVENRLSITQDNETKLFKRVVELEQLISEKDRENNRLLQLHQESNQQHNEELNEEIQSLRNELIDIKQRYQVNLNQLHHDQQKISELQHSLDIESSNFREKISQSENEKMILQQKCHESENLITAFRTSLATKDSLLSDAEKQMSSLTHDAEAAATRWEKKRDELEHDRIRLQARLNDAEKQLMDTKQQLQQSRHENFVKDTTITETIAKNASMMEEKRILESKCQSFMNEIQDTKNLIQKHEAAIESKTSELESIKGQYNILKDHKYKDALTELSQIGDRLR
jgi:chromosome segregation ATPase